MGNYLNGVATHPPAAKGWPDVFAVRGTEAIAWELKTEGGRVAQEQQEWLKRLNCVPGIEARVVRPSHLKWVESRLRMAPSQLELTLTTNSTTATLTMD